MSTEMPSLKGLANNPGENNCFLNSTIQILWHLPLFRSSLSTLYGHYCMQEKCVFCALKTLFIQLEKVNKPSIPPGVLRQAMAGAFHSEDRFQLGEMDDAAECYEHLLARLHHHLTRNCSEDTCTSPHCITHAKFSMNIFEQSCCGCGEQSEPLTYSQVIQYVSASAVVSTVAAQQTGQLSFGRYIHEAIQSGDARMCSGGCKQMAATRRYLMNCPAVFCIGVVWNSNTPPVDEIMLFVNAIEPAITVDHMFNQVTDQKSAGKKLQLVGIVMYYGLHYSSLFLSQSTKKWTYFDDSNVRVLDEKLSTVKDLCRRGHYQPLLLVYIDPDGEPVDFESAPATVVPMDRQHEMETLRQLSPLNRSMSKKQSLSGVASPRIDSAGKSAAASSSGARPPPLPELVANLIDLSPATATGTAPSPQPTHSSGMAQRQQQQPQRRPVAPSAPMAEAPAGLGTATAQQYGAPLAQPSSGQGSASPPRPHQAHGAVSADQRREVQRMRDQRKSETRVSSSSRPSPTCTASGGDLIDLSGIGGYQRISQQVSRHTTQLSQQAAAVALAPMPAVSGNAMSYGAAVSQSAMPQAGRPSAGYYSSSGASSGMATPSTAIVSNLMPVPAATATAAVGLPTAHLTHAQAPQTHHIKVASSPLLAQPVPSPYPHQQQQQQQQHRQPSQQQQQQQQQHQRQRQASQQHATTASAKPYAMPASSPTARPRPVAAARQRQVTSSSHGSSAPSTLPSQSSSSSTPLPSAWGSSQPHCSTAYQPARSASGTASSSHEGASTTAYQPARSASGTASSSHEGASTTAYQPARSASGTASSSHEGASTTARISARLQPVYTAQSARSAHSAQPAAAAGSSVDRGSAASPTSAQMLEQVEQLCVAADNWMVRSAERDSEGKIVEAVECLREASRSIEEAISTASSDRKLLANVHRQAALIARCKESQERRLLASHPTSSQAGRKAKPASSNRSQTASSESKSGRDVADGNVSKPALKVSTQAAAATSSAGFLAAPVSQDVRSPSPTPAAVDQFMASLGDATMFNTKPENYGEAYHAFHQAQAGGGWLQT